MIYLKQTYPALFREIDPQRYALSIRTNILVFTGYSIAAIETLIAIKCGLTPISYGSTALISATVLTSTMIITAAVYLAGKLLLWQEWLMFITHLVIYSATFGAWVYGLEELRILGLLSSLMAVTIVLQYTKKIQSTLMSLTTLICYFAIVYYSIIIKNQPGSLFRELFLTLSMIPAFILVAVAADFLNKKNDELNETKTHLEKINDDLVEINSKLTHEQHLSEIEMDLAHDIQRALFPLTSPITDDWDIAFKSKPKSGVSGDFYDFYCTDKSLKGLSLFDVSGHGVSSALITILAKPVIFKNFNNLKNEHPGRILKASHMELLEQLEEVNSYITGILMRINKSSIEYVNAGHPDILHKNYSTGNVRAITDKNGEFKGGPLGIGSIKLKYNTIKFSVQKNDFIVIYSGGLTECRNNRGLAFGFGRLMESMSRIEETDSSAILKEILSDFNTFRGDEPEGDDYTIIVARKK